MRSCLLLKRHDLLREFVRRHRQVKRETVLPDGAGVLAVRAVSGSGAANITHLRDPSHLWFPSGAGVAMTAVASYGRQTLRLESIVLTPSPPSSRQSPQVRRSCGHSSPPPARPGPSAGTPGGANMRVARPALMPGHPPVLNMRHQAIRVPAKGEVPIRSGVVPHRHHVDVPAEVPRAHAGLVGAPSRLSRALLVGGGHRP